MKKYLAVFLTVVMIASGVYVNPVITQSASEKDIYQGNYGIQLGEVRESLDRYIYSQLVQSYIYQKGDSGNTNDKYTGLAKPLTNGGEIALGADLIAHKTFKNETELKSYNWGESAEYKFIDSAVRNAFDAFVKDYPQAYWLKGMGWKGELDVRNITSKDNGIEVEAVFKTTLKPKEYEKEIVEYIKSFNDEVCKAKESIVRQNKITSDTKTEDMVKVIHDWIASKTDYNYDVVNNATHKDYNYAHTPLPIFVKSKSGQWGDKVVCEGYAKAFKILCDQFNIGCAILVGKSINLKGQYESHMWNAVQVLNQWYAVDVAWDDQGSAVYSTYLLVGRRSQGFYGIYEKDHIPSNQFSSYENSKAFILPQIAEKGFWQKEETTDKIVETSTTEVVTGPNETITSENKTTPAETNMGSTEVPTTKQPSESHQGETSTNSGGIKKVSYHWMVSGLVKNKTYTGKQVKQKIKITCDGKALKEGTDYKISYKNNTNVGTAKILITPLGKYKSAKALNFSYDFKIVKASITKASANKIKKQKYKKGKAIKPTVKLKFNGKSLKKGKDYTISYSNHKKKGTAKIKIKGKGNFKGTKTIKFKIK